MGRDPELGISFNDNDRDNIEDVGDDKEEKTNNYIGEAVVENRIEDVGHDKKEKINKYVGAAVVENSMDNIEDVDHDKKEKTNKYVVENREELEEFGDDSDYGGSGDHESQVFGELFYCFSHFDTF